jgi:hypothetical protein
MFYGERFQTTRYLPRAEGFPSIGGFEPRDHYLCMGDVSGDMGLTVTAFLSYSFCTPECLLGPLLEGNRWPRVFYLASKA